MRVDLETIDLIQALRRSINSTPLEDIEFYEKGEKLKIDPRNVKRFDFTGLSNIDFITTNFYKKGFDNEN